MRKRSTWPARFSRFLIRPEMWQAFGEPPELSGPAHAHYAGHVHSHLVALRGLLACAHAVNDPDLMRFVRDGYEYTRSLGIPQIGWIPEWTNNNAAEGCEIADAIALAIRLT